MPAIRPSSSSIKDFCQRHGISQASFYRHIETMPRRIKLGGQFRILDFDEEEWLEAKRAETQTGRAA